ILAATGAFSSVGFTNVNGFTPTVAQMQQYDAIAVFTYLSVAAAFGNNLKTYLESGGGVVLFDYEAQEMGTWQLQGAYQGTYTMMPLSPTASFVTTITTLGAILEPGSPIMTGVNTLSWKAGATAYHLNAVPGNGGIVVANWADGKPCVIRGNINGHTVV